MDDAPYEFDLVRIFLGENPPIFLLEVVFRTVIIFAYTLLLLRWMGKRGMGQLTPFELVIIVALGSAVGDPMFYDNVPLLHTMLVITIVIGMQRLLVYFTEHDQQLEALIESEPCQLVDEGCILLDNLHSEAISREELFQSLRENGVQNLGEVDAAFLEPSGRVSVIRSETPGPGLSVLPSGAELTEQDAETDQWCCGKCGYLAGRVDVPPHACPRCASDEWQAAIIAPAGEDK